MRILYHCLAALTDKPLANSIVGDLEEVKRSGRHIWRTALGILLHIVGVRLREALGAVRTSRGGTSGAGGDLRQALRTIQRRRGFAASIVVLLALGIGANTAAFSIVHAVLLEPLPYRDLDRLVYVWRSQGTNSQNRHEIQTSSRLHAIARHNTTLESFAITKPWETAIEGIVDLIASDRVERLRGASVTPNFFELLGVGARLGRTFTSLDDEAAPVAVISHALWLRMFGGDEQVLGKSIRLARGNMARTQPSYTIVGVLPAEMRFTYPRETEIYLLLPWTRVVPTNSLEYTLIARLRDGVTIAQAEAEMTAIAIDTLRTREDVSPEFLQQAIESNRALVEPMQQHVAAEVRPGVLLLAAVAGLVLLIVCVNVALVSLANATDRAGELGVRAALGAGPGRLARLLLVEHAVLAAMGATAGLAIAAAALPLVRALLPDVVPRADRVTLNAWTLAFAVLATAVTAIIAGAAPAVLSLRRDLLAVVKRSGTASTDQAAHRSRSVILTVQVAVVLVLLVGAGLLLHSFWRIQRVELGFAADDLLTLETRFYNPAYRQTARISAFQDRLIDHVRRIPGVEMASLTTAVPMRGVDFRSEIAPPGGQRGTAHMRSVSPGYFEMLRIPLRAGRTFTDADRAGSPRVMVVSESLAQTHFAAANPIGRRMLYGENEHEIVGVVGDVRYAEVIRDAAPAFYVPRAQEPLRLICLIVKPRPGMRAAVAESLRDAVRTLDPEQPIEGLTTIGEIVTHSTADRRFYTFATTAFGCIALALALAGLFGAVSRTVIERQRELAIRTAVGATARDIVRLVIGIGLGPVVAGAAAGIAVALSGSRLLQRFLFEVAPTDLLTYGSVALLVVLAAVGACVCPTRRALRITPATLLRE